MNGQDVLKIMTFNVFNHECNAQCKTAGAMIDKSECDIVCTQEEPESAKDTEHYTRLKACGVRTEMVGVYYKKNVESAPEFVECIETIPTYGTRRYAILFKYKGILIANLHLEGGRYTDEKLCKGDETEMNKVHEYKMELLRKVIDKNPDIIMGDFNSVYSSNEEQLQQFLKGQSTYFNDKCKDKVSDDFIRKWNVGPFEELQKTYTYANPTNELETYTSALGKSIVDTIWYKTDPNKFTFMESRIVPSMDPYFQSNYCFYSDHNPVVLTIKLTSGGGRRLRRRTVHKSKQRRSHRKRKALRKTHRKQ
jgi:exonuclease III